MENVVESEEKVETGNLEENEKCKVKKHWKSQGPFFFFDLYETAEFFLVYQNENKTKQKRFTPGKDREKQLLPLLKNITLRPCVDRY